MLTRHRLLGFYDESMQKEQYGGLLARSIPVPLQLKVKAGETKRIQVAPRGLVGEKNLGARYQFFCPKHKDIRVSGFIYVD